MESALIEGEQRGLPLELVQLIRSAHGPQYFEALAIASFDTRFTDLIIPPSQQLLTEIAQRWIKRAHTGTTTDEIIIISCFARILPLATYLQPTIKQFLTTSRILQEISNPVSTTLQNHEYVQVLLLALFRLLSHDSVAFTEFAKPVFLCSLLNHEHHYLRYLAIECLCLTMGFADAFGQRLIQDRILILTDKVIGPWEDQQIDYRVLKLFEERRWKTLHAKFQECDGQQSVAVEGLVPRFQGSDFSPLTASIAGVLVPRHGLPGPQSSTFVLLPTASTNLAGVARTLHYAKPTLLVGPSGSGKTAIVRELAHEIQALSSMITLHLNDQTDAKSLLGIYTSSETGGGFTWQPGVLTKAVQEGRWILIEDIDRAPAEVLGLLRPLIENNKLFLPSRKQNLIPRDGFRIFGTIRSSGSSAAGAGGRNNLLANRRLWNVVEISPYNAEEIASLLQARFPNLAPFLSSIMSAHARILQIYSSYPLFKAVQTRLPSIREILKWCRRLSRRLAPLVSSNGTSPAVPETFMIEMLKNGMDCYAAYLDNEDLYQVLADAMAESLNVAPSAAQHALRQQNPIIQQHKHAMQVGRSILPRLGARRTQGTNNSRFALTRKVRQNMEAIAAATVAQEPVLLVGETGVGKTTMLQHIATSIDQNLTVVNLSNQSEASDLLGGLKPVTTRSLLIPLVDEFESLFDDTFSANKNEKFRQSISKAFAKQRWQRLVGHWEEAVQLAQKSLPVSSAPEASEEQTAKRRKVDHPKYQALRLRWTSFANNINQVKAQIQRGEQGQVFTFVESRLVQAVRNGSWLLLDEINLASSETLDNLLSLLHNGDDDTPYLLLTEAGSIERINAHPNFRVFAAMNPATDTGKKDLPFAVRTHFTEIYIHAGDTDINDLVEVVQAYLGSALDTDKKAANDLAKAYLALKQLNFKHKLTDGAGDLPHFSLRSLTRCLQYIQQHNPSHGLRRAIYEGVQMSFFTVLDLKSQQLALTAVEQHLIPSAQARKAILGQKSRVAASGDQYIAFGHHFIPKGPLTSDVNSNYIITSSVRQNLMNLARASSMRRFPILLQGPTSAGKTSMVEYLAKFSGNKFVRINNHEHTDLQEYLGNYASNADGKLEYREGVLVEALRKGYWIVLDELNLAPSDVLEALNRLLDDNRELLIPESQEIVHPHPNFMLFATQNPAGLYGGRKRLSRAFRNRFLEIHVDDIPENELEQILTERSQIAPQYCKRIVKVYKDLSLQRQSSRLFEARNSFATLRDLFRWASRPADNRDQLAYHGYMLLAERVRDPAEKEIVKTTIEENFKVKLSDDLLYDVSKLPSAVLSNSKVTWTRAMRRLFVLVATALQNNEPVLLVGETGCGKTQVCQCIAEAFGKQLNIYNAHSNTETGDLIGSQRPMRHKSDLAKDIVEDLRSLGEHYDSQRTIESMDVEDLIIQFKTMNTSDFDSALVEKIHANITAYQSLFLWSDGSLVRAMKEGSHFLLDEISLADDSVLERMNSLLEPARSILLAEKGAYDNFVVAEPGFQFLATMNPGGDYGKRELSAALRNRLTEIWVPALSDDEDVLPILETRLSSLDMDSNLAPIMISFARYFTSEIQGSSSTTVPLRTLLTWSDFILANAALGIEQAVVHGAAIAFIDSLGANPAGLSGNAARDLLVSRDMCLTQLSELLRIDARSIYNTPLSLELGQADLTIGSFSIPRSPMAVKDDDLVFEAPTTLRNAMRLVRALQTSRPLLLEGNPGVGKTAIVSSLAKMCGRPLTRINLSDQTDLMDLFGADAPAIDESFGSFVWRDGPLLTAMQSGGWVLLDEMNLASQSVLEGLNACLDHRQEVYIAELDKTFKCHPEFTLFATQNPHHQGGGRKGLPASFVNRFVVVYADPFARDDLVSICQLKYPMLHGDVVHQVVETIDGLQQLASQRHEFHDGGPWELNLRDLHRWLALCDKENQLEVSSHFNTVVGHRFRGLSARNQAVKLCQEIFGVHEEGSLYHDLTQLSLQVGTSFLHRSRAVQSIKAEHFVHNGQLATAKSVITALNQRWPIILVGSSDSGKTSLVRTLAALSGSRLVEFSMNADVDAADLIGGYEQYDDSLYVNSVQDQIKAGLFEVTQDLFLRFETDEIITTISVLEKLQKSDLSAQELQRVMQPILDNKDLATRILSDDIHERLQEIVEVVPPVSARFVWNDGILIDALQSGSWLVLDNANLCNPSVLDRLNSLLEPNGSLIISEQHGEDGRVRIVEPHSDFRIFLTMDPRYGELSRAMRNRSLEIFMEGKVWNDSAVALPQYPSASEVARLRDLSQGSSETMSNVSALEPWLGNLSLSDLTLTEYIPADCDNKELKEAADIKLSPLVANYGSRDILEKVMLNNENLLVNAGTQHAMLLINEPVTQICASPAQRLDLWRLTCWAHLATRTLRYQADLTNLNKRATERPANTLTWLERTAPSIAKQSRRKQSPPIQAYTFVDALLQFSMQFIKSTTDRWQDLEAYEISEALANLLEDLIRLFSQLNVTESQCGAYLQVMAHIFTRLKGYDILLSKQFSIVIDYLGEVHDLAQFQSLQRMWPVWKGRETVSEAQLAYRLQMEKLIERFDSMCSQLPHSRADLAKIRLRLLDTLDSIDAQPDAESQIEAFATAVNELDEQHKIPIQGQPQFAALFENVYRKMWCRGADVSCLQAQKWILLGPTSLAALVPDKQNDSTTSLLARVGAGSSTQDRVMYRGMVAPGEFSLRDMAHALSSMYEQPIGRMNHAIEELSELARAFARNARALTTSSLPSLCENSAKLIHKVVLAHKEFLAPEAAEAVDEPIDCSKIEAFLSQIAKNAKERGHEDVSEKLGTWLTQSVQNLTGEASYDKCGEALLVFATFTLSLMMTGKAFDPAQYLALVSQRHQRRIDDSTERTLAWGSFQAQHCGQDTSFIIRMLRSTVSALGQAPTCPTIYRPGPQFLGELSNELGNLQRTILSDPELIAQMTDTEEHHIGPAMLDKITRCISRLSNIHRAYDDLVQPIIGLLRIMGLGIKLLIYSMQHEESGDGDDTEMSYNPHVASILEIQKLERSIRRMDPLIHRQTFAIDYARDFLGMPQTWTYLEQLKVKFLISCPQPDVRAHTIAHITNIIEGPYYHWLEQVDQDRAKEEINSRYYSYRGGDDTDEIKEVDVRKEFPSFDDDGRQGETEPETNGEHEETIGAGLGGAEFDVRKTAIQLARYHRSLFTITDHKELLRTYLRERMHPGDGTHPEFKEGQFLTPEMTPALFLSMQDKLREFSGKDAKLLNIYTDSDLAETQKLFKLANEATIRFAEIKSAWPDHAVPSEVLQFLKEVMSLKMSDPIAKLLTKAEKMLEVISRWQAVASREWSVVGIIENLTNLIISWRRLELGSWSRLLDVEDNKQQDDADAWYFIAFGAVVEKSLKNVVHDDDVGFMDEPEMRPADFRRELAKTLEEYLRTTTLGQYSSRLELLRVFAHSVDAFARCQLQDWNKHCNKKLKAKTEKQYRVDNEIKLRKPWATERFDGDFYTRDKEIITKEEFLAPRSETPSSQASYFSDSSYEEDRLDRMGFGDSDDEGEQPSSKLQMAQDLDQIRDVILSVIDHHTRYEPQIRKTLLDGRAALEKRVTEQIKLASWKDTNITALKESARRSHSRLFRIIKKYRSLLAQPITVFNSSYTPNTLSRVESKSDIVQVPSLENVATHVALCQSRLEDWSIRPERLKNPAGATATMRHVYISVLPEFSISSELASYLEDITSSSQELRKATPGTLTDDNKALVRDLKQRKRKLLADTMKDLSQMGVRRNLGTNELESQGSRAQIYADLPRVSTDHGAGKAARTSEAFSELLDGLPYAREAAVKHSEELSSGEVTRGLGYLEGLLALSIKQRSQQGKFGTQVQKLQEMTSLVKIMQDHSFGNVILSAKDEEDQFAWLKHRTACLPVVLEVYAGIVDFQQQQGELDFGDFSIKLNEYGSLMRRQYSQLESLEALPFKVSNDRKPKVMQDASQLIDRLRDSLESYAANEPELEYISAQLGQWLMPDPEGRPEGIWQGDKHAILPVKAFEKSSREFLDMIFVALQSATETLKGLPSSSEDKEWLVKSTDVFERAVKLLHLDTLSDSCEKLLNSLRFLVASDLQVGVSLLVAASPMIQQFHAICMDVQKRMEESHLHTTQLAVFLCKTFTTLAKDGFCGPSEASEGQEQTGKVEQGTGLGEGEAAEDISKDVADDEDLADLAQQPGEREDHKEDMEKSKDAVDMGPDELEGEMGSGDEQGSQDEDDASDGEEGEDQDQNEETGSVDNLDPNAVDEKMWDDMQKEAEKEEKEMKSQKAKGQKTDDQAAKTEGEEQEDGDDAEMDADQDENEDDAADDEGQQQADGENVDPHLQEEQALDLPEDMQLNGEDEMEGDISDMEMDKMSDVDNGAQPDDKQEVDELPNEDKLDREDSPEQDEPGAEDEEDLPNGKAGDDEVVEDQPEEGEDEKDETHDTRNDDEMGDVQDQENGESGLANTDQPDLDAERDDNAPQGQNETETAAQQSEPQKGVQSNAEQQSGANQGALEQGVGRQEETPEKQNDALKKLADVLEKYHQRREIFTASEDRQQQQAEQDVDMADADFEHLDDDDDQNETQALGTSNQEVSQNIDKSQAIEEADSTAKDDLPMPEDVDRAQQEEQETVIQKFERLQGERAEKEDNQIARNAIVPESAQERPRRDVVDTDVDMINTDEQDDDLAHDVPVLDQSRSLAIRGTTTSLAEAQQLWSLTSNKTQSLSLMLTEQLRLILQPTTATKLRGDFRTGKRLNIRRIIPYIASGYKRDKIWMRRSVPSKRNYQIMLAVDDSKSMAESGADILALETLCMLSRSLSMLEVGEISIVAFGADYDTNPDAGSVNNTSSSKAVKVAHPFSTPFSPNQSGPQLFQNFTFSQTATNIHALLTQSLHLFRTARLQSSAQNADDLWQLQIIISDGHIGSDPQDSIRRLVRKAREEKIMCVFVIVDCDEESIVDLPVVFFETVEKNGESEEVMRTRRYLEIFPFQYYVVVREVRDLPGVLSRVLKGWFEGVVEMG